MIIIARHAEIYKKREWERVRSFVIARANGLCERCKEKGIIKQGKIVHHSEWLTYDNKHDWNVAYNPENLEYICNDCHENEHRKKTSPTREGLCFDANGDLVRSV